MSCDCDWESWSENILVSLPLLSLWRRRSDGSSLGEQRKHVLEGSSVALLWQVPPRRRVLSEVHLQKGLIRSRLFQGEPTAGNQPPASFRTTGGQLIAPLDSRLFCNLEILWLLLTAHISDARRSRLLLQIHRRRDSGSPVHLCALDCLCPSHFSSALIAATSLLLSLDCAVHSWNPWWGKGLNVLWINNQSIVLFTSPLEVYKLTIPMG